MANLLLIAATSFFGGVEIGEVKGGVDCKNLWGRAAAAGIY